MLDEIRQALTQRSEALLAPAAVCVLAALMRRHGLLELPAARFELVLWKKAKVHRDSHLAWDGSVTRDSALMDERLGQRRSTSLRAPPHWGSVHFSNGEHSDLNTMDDVLYLLLQSPRGR